MRRLAIRGVLSAKAADGQIVLVDSFAELEPRTRAMLRMTLLPIYFKRNGFAWLQGVSFRFVPMVRNRAGFDPGSVRF